MNNLPNFILPTGPRLKPQRQPASRSVPSSSSSTSISPSQSICDDVQWDEKYTPTSVDDLVVRKQRIDAIKALIQGSALHKREGYKLLLLKGPAGSCKSTAFRVLVSSLGYQIIEWENPTRTGGYDADDYETLAGRFERFMMQSTGSHTLTSNRPKILFFDDIPDLTTDSVRQQFQAVLTSYIQSQRVFFLVIAISDAYLAADRAGRRYGQESRLTNAGDLMTKDMIATGKCTELEFNPVTQFNVKKVLNRILQAERLSVAGNKALVDRIAVECHGDLRCSILTLQLYTLGQETSLKRKRGHVHGRYEPLELFHLVGKVLFAKRDDGVLQSKPHLMLDNCGNNHHTVLGWIYFNYHPFLTDIDQAAAIMGHMSDADVLGTNWMESEASEYEMLVSMHGMMANLEDGRGKSKSAGEQFKLSAPWENWYQYGLAQPQHKRRTPVVTPSLQNEGQSMHSPIQAYSDDEFDDIYGDGADLALLDF